MIYMRIIDHLACLFAFKEHRNNERTPESGRDRPRQQEQNVQNQPERENLSRLKHAPPPPKKTNDCIERRHGRTRANGSRRAKRVLLCRPCGRHPFKCSKSTLRKRGGRPKSPRTQENREALRFFAFVLTMRGRAQKRDRSLLSTSELLPTQRVHSSYLSGTDARYWLIERYASCVVVMLRLPKGEACAHHTHQTPENQAESALSV